MKTQSCERYLEDPEANAGHLAECEECRALFGETAVATKPLHIEALPLAPWEGAKHRPWPLVALVAFVLLAASVVLCRMAGVSAAEIADHVIGSMQARRAAVLGWADSLREASRAAQIGFVAAFVIVNAVLIALLRRAPRGIDA